MAVKSALMGSASLPTYRNDAEKEEKEALKEEKKEGAAGSKDDSTKADADAGEKLDRMLTCLDSMSKRMDALEEADKKKDSAKSDDDDDDDDARKDKRKDKRKDSRRKDEHDEKIAADKKRKDEWPDKDEKKDSAKSDDDDDDDDDDKAKELAADKAKKDAKRKDDDDDAKRKDSRADSDLAELRAIVARLERAHNITSEDRANMAVIQSRADSVYQMFGDSAPKFMDGEEPLDYQRRLIKKMQPKSAEWKDIDLSRADSAMLDLAEKKIFADAILAAQFPTDLAEGQLRMVRKPDETGRQITTWYGEPRSWMQEFMPPTRRVTSFETRVNQR
jgi:hypothetical protein